MTKILKSAPLVIAFLLLLIAPASSHAQAPSETPVPIKAQGGISYSAGLPTGEFGDTVGRTAHGINLYYGRRVGSLPLYLGFDVDIGQYGSEEQTVDVFGVDGTFRTDSFLYQPHLSARYQPVTGRFRPFFEGLVGANILSTSTTWEDFGTTVEAPQDADETSVAFSAGLGVGLDVRVARVKPFGHLGLTGSVHYIYGSEADAPVAEGVAVEEANLSTVSTNTSLFQPQIGLYLEF
jgi:opacity protein-like surface antigen